MMLQEKGEMSIAIKKLTPFPTTYPLIQKFFFFKYFFFIFYEKREWLENLREVF